MIAGPASTRWLVLTGAVLVLALSGCGIPASSTTAGAVHQSQSKTAALVNRLQDEYLDDMSNVDGPLQGVNSLSPTLDPTGSQLEALVKPAKRALRKLIGELMALAGQAPQVPAADLRGQARAVQAQVQALALLERAQGPAAFRRNLNHYRSAVASGIPVTDSTRQALDIFGQG